MQVRDDLRVAHAVLFDTFGNAALVFGGISRFDESSVKQLFLKRGVGRQLDPEPLEKRLASINFVLGRVANSFESWRSVS